MSDLSFVKVSLGKWEWRRDSQKWGEERKIFQNLQTEKGEIGRLFLDGSKTFENICLAKSELPNTLWNIRLLTVSKQKNTIINKVKWW